MKYVCTGATLKCTMGTANSKLMATPKNVSLTGKDQANIADFVSMVNVLPFGNCRSLAYPPTASATAANHGRLTPMPCVPGTCLKWMAVDKDSLICGEPALLKPATLQCSFGGTISIVDPGQTLEVKDGAHKHKNKKDKDYIGQDNGVNTVNESVIRKEVFVSPQKNQNHIPSPVAQNINTLFTQIAIDINNKELEIAFGIKKRSEMSVAEADKQNANPNYAEKFIKDPQGNYVDKLKNVRYRKNVHYKDSDVQYSINCATCATAYALRLRGFNVKAKGNVKGSGSLNEKISKAANYKDLWRNADGSEVTIDSTYNWMRKNGIDEMGVDDYRNYFNNVCKDKGVYVVMIKWEGSSGHAAILQRDNDGKLYYIEPQKFDETKTTDGRRPLDDLLVDDKGKSRLSSNPTPSYGVLRVDDKLFNPQYVNLFEI